jgi:methionine aminopeptidase
LTSELTTSYFTLVKCMTFLMRTRIYIMDGHNSHAALDVTHLAPKSVWMVEPFLASHTSQVTQPLDVSIFQPLKMTFRIYRDFKSLRSKRNVVTKEDLTQWVSMALKKAMTSVYIRGGKIDT